MTKKKVVKKKKIGASTIVIAVLSILLTGMLVLNLTGAWFTDREHASNQLEFGAIELQDIDRDVFVISEPRRSETILMPGHTLRADFEIAIPDNVVNIRNAFVRSSIKVTFNGDQLTGDPLTGRLGAIAAAMGGEGTKVVVEDFNPHSTEQQAVEEIYIPLEGGGFDKFTDFAYVGSGAQTPGIAALAKPIDNTNQVTYKLNDVANATYIFDGSTAGESDVHGNVVQDNSADATSVQKAKLILERFNMIYKFKFDFNKDIADEYETYKDYTIPGHPEGVAKWKTAVDSAGTYWNYYYRELKPGAANKITMDYAYELVGYKIGNALQQVQITFDLEVQAVQAENLGWDNNTTSYPGTGAGGAGQGSGKDESGNLNGSIDQHPGATNTASGYVAALTGYTTGANIVTGGLHPVDKAENASGTERNADNAIVAFAQVLGITGGVITGADVDGAYKPVTFNPTDPEWSDPNDRDENLPIEDEDDEEPVTP